MELADEHGVAIVLEVDAFDEDGLDNQQLADWYWRFGFRGTPDEMVREPSET